MPAPSYGQPQVNEQPLQPTRQDPNAPMEAFGGGAAVEAQGKAGQEIGAAGAQLGDRIETAQIQAAWNANQAVVQNANLAAQQARDTAIGRISNAHGPDAAKQQGPIGDDLKKQIDDIKSGMTKQQQAMAGAQLNGHLIDYAKVSQTHLDTENKNWQRRTSVAAIDGLVNDSASFAGNKTRVADNIKHALVVQAGLLDEQGIHTTIDPQTGDVTPVPSADGSNEIQYKFEKLKLTSRINMAVIQAKLDADAPQSAKAFFDSNKNSIDVNYHKGVLNAIEQGQIKTTAPAIADTYGNMYQHQDDAEVAIKAKYGSDPKLAKAAVLELNRFYNDKKNNAADMLDHDLAQARDTSVQNGTTSPISAVILAGFNDRQRAGLNIMADRSKGIDHPYDDSVNAKYATMDPDKLKVLRENQLITEVQPYVTNKQYTDIHSAWQGLNDADVKTQAKVRGFMSTKQMMMASLQDAKQMTGDKDADGKTFGAFERHVQDAFLNESARSEKPLDDKQKQDIIKKLLVQKVMIAGNHAWNSDTEKPTAVLNEDQQGRSYINAKDIPVNAAKSMQIYYAEKGGIGALSKDRLQRAYAAKIEGDRKRFDSIMAGN